MPIGKPKEPKAPKEKKVKAPKEKKVKVPKEKKPKKPKKGKAPEEEEVKSGEDTGEGAEGGEPKKKKFPILMLLPVVVIIAAAVIVFVFILPKRDADAEPEPTVSEEPEPPDLPTEILVGETPIVGMTLEADESEAQAEKAKTVTYTYTNLNDAGKAAQTYAKQLAGEDPAFSVVDEEFVIQRTKPDYTTADGMVLLARNIPVEVPDPAPTASPEDEDSEDDPEAQESEPDAQESQVPEEEPETAEEVESKVLMVRITWSPGQCVVTADEVVGKVTAPPRSSATSGGQSITTRGAQERLESMTPAQLGLSGESMSEYEVFPIDGTELVNGAACIRLNVYNGNNVEHSNEFMGSYLMSLDGLHLYRLNPSTNEIEELEYNP